MTRGTTIIKGKYGDHRCKNQAITDGCCAIHSGKRCNSRSKSRRQSKRPKSRRSRYSSKSSRRSRTRSNSSLGKRNRKSKSSKSKSHSRKRSRTRSSSRRRRSLRRQAGYFQNGGGFWNRLWGGAEGAEGAEERVFTNVRKLKEDISSINQRISEDMQLLEELVYKVCHDKLSSVEDYSELNQRAEQIKLRTMSIMDNLKRKGEISPEAKREIAQLESDITRINAEQKALSDKCNEELSVLEASHANLETEMASLENALADLQEKLQEAKGNSMMLTQQIAESQEKLDAKKEECSQRSEKLSSELSSAQNELDQYSKQLDYGPELVFDPSKYQPTQYEQQQQQQQDSFRSQDFDLKQQGSLSPQDLDLQQTYDIGVVSSQRKPAYTDPLSDDEIEPTNVITTEQRGPQSLRL